MSCYHKNKCVEDTPCKNCYFDGYTQDDFEAELEKMDLARRNMREKFGWL